MFERMVYYINGYDGLAPRCRGRWYVTEIKADGNIIVEKYTGRKKVSTENCSVPVEDIREFYLELRECIETANGIEHFYDDHDGRLIIYHPFGRSESMPKGLGHGINVVGYMVMHFAAKYSELLKRW